MRNPLGLTRGVPSISENVKGVVLKFLFLRNTNQKGFLTQKEQRLWRDNHDFFFSRKGKNNSDSPRENLCQYIELKGLVMKKVCVNITTELSISSSTNLMKLQSYLLAAASVRMEKKKHILTRKQQRNEQNKCKV